MGLMHLLRRHRRLDTSLTAHFTYVSVRLAHSLPVAWVLFCFLLNLAIILPAMTLLQPDRLLQYLRAKRRARTPRQQFRR